jgi:hypothetical protein
MNATPRTVAERRVSVQAPSIPEPAVPEYFNRLAAAWTARHWTFDTPPCGAIAQARAS